MSSNTRRRLRATILGALSLISSTAAAKPAAEPEKLQPAVIGQVTTRGREEFLPVVILRGANRYTVIRPFTAVYARDRIFVTQRDATAHVEFYGEDPYPVSGRYHYDEKTSYTIPDAAPGSLWTLKGFNKILSLGSWVMYPPQARAGKVTTADGPKGAAAGKLKPAAFLPASSQTIRSTSGDGPLPIIWKGGQAQVRLMRDCRSVVAEDTSSEDGFLELGTPSLAEGAYCLEILPVDGAGTPNRKNGFTIPVKVAAGPTPLLEEEPAVIQAVTALKGPASGRLQALSDLGRLKHRSFKAWMVYRGIARGAAR